MGNAKITLQKNGPLLVEGNVPIVAADGKLLSEKSNCALCRCGQSKSKPFCDWTHVKIGWKDE